MMTIMPDEKVARICWNTKGWTKPSGRNGKSRNKQSYEYLTGFGHEEWLLDVSKLIDGYHYAFLEAVSGRFKEKYIGQIYNISLYSINNETRQRYWIGTINNVEVIDRNDSGQILDIYKQNGWYEEMLNQLQVVDADIDRFYKEIEKNFLVNVRFKAENLQLLEMPEEFSSKDPAIKSNYYNLKNKVSEPQFISCENFIFQRGHNEGKKSKITSYEQHDKSVNLLHNAMQTTIYNQFVREFGKGNVGTENHVGQGNRIDLVIKHENSYSFYEIKTDNSVRKCIREALGQLVEYAHFYDDITIEKLVVVSHSQANNKVLSYLSKIREKYNIPLYYQHFDIQSQSLNSELI